jgi:hypothetical protein
MACGESLRSICKDPGMPDMGTIRNWVIRDHDGFAERYARARSMQADTWVSEAVDLARDTPTDAGSVAKARLVVDTIKWTACHLMPHRYGDRISTTVAGPDGGPLKIALAPLSALEKDEMALLKQILQRRAGAQGKGGDDGDEQG